jgi:hypothetical protein
MRLMLFLTVGPVFEIRQAVAQLQLLCADRQGEARGVSLGHRRRFE